LNGERNGKGKEYFIDSNIIFEGEYLNGKRWNGKGYDKNRKIIFEIKNGNGKVKEFGTYYKNLIVDINDKTDNILYYLKFEGEYLNGLKNGKGKEYNDKNILLFEGDI
jgi:antitoxin component YwqK of YwqJK toxin-antitoxin module